MHDIFALASPVYYERLSRRQIASEYIRLLHELLPSEWAIKRDEVWLHARSPREKLPLSQGFKIHVSSIPRFAELALKSVIPACINYNLDFKIAADPTLLALVNSKRYPRGSSGKFITIYPYNDAIFAMFIEELYQILGSTDIKGPYILSDKQYKDSGIIFYRYGGIRPPERLNIDGTLSTLLTSPSGEFIDDLRLPYFQLPAWVNDPFQDRVESSGPTKFLVGDRFTVDEAVSFSNCGGVYTGVDTITGRPIVIKEARAFTHCWDVGDFVGDAAYLLKHEYRMMRRLYDLEFIPEPICLIESWKHTFLVEERIDALSIYQYFSRPDVIMSPYVRRSGIIERWLPKFVYVARQLIKMVSAVHEHGIVLGDLSPHNILIAPETMRIWFIDFESAVDAITHAGMSTYAAKWGTPGFIRPGRSSRTTLLPEDDLYAVAMVLYSCVIPTNGFFALAPKSQSMFLDKYVEWGVPVMVKDVIEHLLGGDVQGALACLGHQSG